MIGVMITFLGFPSVVLGASYVFAVTTEQWSDAKTRAPRRDDHSSVIG